MMSSSYQSSAASSYGGGVGDDDVGAEQEEAPPQPRRLELSVNPEDGSLTTAPLSQVLLATTDALYSDLFSMAHGDLDVVTGGATATATTSGGGGVDAAAADDEQQQDANNNGGSISQHGTTATTTKRERMSNLSFAQRRHELQWRLAQHGRRLQHVAALTAANASTDFAGTVRVSSEALRHARTAWMHADEAQDALYFFHAQLFPSRQPPHDVYGACDVLLGRSWYDLPDDLRLVGADRYRASREASWNRDEVLARWRLSVREKLVRGEVGYEMMKMKNRSRGGRARPYRLSLRGGIVKMTHGLPKRTATTTTAAAAASLGTTTGANDDDDAVDDVYPIVALLTVLSPSAATAPAASSAGAAVPTADAEWSLISLEVRVEAKTGEFNHQLETSTRQRYNLHRLAELAMRNEEKRVRALRAQQEANAADQVDADGDAKMAAANDSGVEEDPVPPAHPLQALFEVAHTFLLSWQLELLSAQAQALRRGVWAAGTGNPIQVTTVRFFDEDGKSGGSTGSGTDANIVLGVVSVSFWKVDDSYGPPSMGDLVLEDGGEEDDDSKSKNDARAVSANASGSTGRAHYAATTNQLTLSIRAESTIGIRVSLSGASSADLNRQPHLRLRAEEILQAASNPLSLSISDALLAATRLCAERKCHAVAQALQSSGVLPPWVLVTVERGSIAIACRIKYHGITSVDAASSEEHSLPFGLPTLFRLECDSRTGSFVHIFSRQVELLRHLACNSSDASEPMSLRIASLPPNRRRASWATSSGRHTRDAFEALIRSLNLLGQRTGVGGAWDDQDDKSSLLRERAVQSACADVRVSLLKSCGLAALFGLTPLAIGAALGLDAMADMYVFTTYT